MASDPKLCPCCSGQRYRTCCRPLHRAEREAQTPSQLMRARYAAFAIRDVAYVLRTLHPDNLDACRPAAEALRILRASAAQHTFPRLRILGERTLEGGDSQVLFFAEVYARGKDRSFAERSDFRRVEASWRYRTGVAVPLAKLSTGPAELTFEGFAAQGLEAP